MVSDWAGKMAGKVTPPESIAIIAEFTARINLVATPCSLSGIH